MAESLIEEILAPGVAGREPGQLARRATLDAMYPSMLAPLTQPRLTGLTVYPIKGAAGISFTSAEVDSFGLHFDRRWMTVDRDGVFSA
jgi:hypothetical protein